MPMGRRLVWMIYADKSVVRLVWTSTDCEGIDCPLCVLQVTKFKPGDKVVACFDLGCGECFYCKRGLWSCCQVTNASCFTAPLWTPVPLRTCPSVRM